MKNIKCIYLLSVICICFFVSCKEQNAEKKFFDVPEYFHTQIDTITYNFKSAIKFLKYNNDSSETGLLVSEANWEKELSLFIECDINKPIYYSSMTKEIVKSDSNFVNEVYSNTRNNAPVKEMTIVRKDNQIKEVKINIEKDNLISTTNMQLSYKPSILIPLSGRMMGYSISGTQFLKGLNQKTNFEVVVVII